MAKEGLIDGCRSGFPCTTFTRLRWREARGYPGPVRSKDHPYGLPTNTEKEAKEADEGTIHATRSVLIGKRSEGQAGKQKSGRGGFSTLENPPPSDVQGHLSAWELPEVEEFAKEQASAIADFHTCAYQLRLPVQERRFKPQRLVGSLKELRQLESQCKCGVGKHLPVKAANSASSAEYPQELAEKYARLAINHFKRMGTKDWLMEKESRLAKEIEELRNKQATMPS